MGRMIPLVEYVARWLHNLPETHQINLAFGQKLFFDPSLAIGAPERNIFLFSFPKLVDGAAPPNTFMGSGELNMLAETRPAVCIVPTSGEAPSYAMGAYNPGFLILCRHEYSGSAYSCLQEIIYALTHKARVFPQNGVILARNSQPSLAFGTPGTATHVYQASFRVLAADQIR